VANISASGRSGRTPRSAVGAEVLAATERLLVGGERFASLSVQRICDEAGVARSAFYVNFDDKTDLLLRLVAAATQDIAEIAAGWIESEPTLGLEALVAAQTRAVAVYREHDALLRASAETAAYEDRVAAVWRGRLDGIIATFAERLRGAQRSGEVRADIDAEVAARLVILGVEQVMRDHVERGADSADRALASHLGQLIWLMLRPSS